MKLKLQKKLTLFAKISVNSINKEKEICEAITTFYILIKFKF